MNLINDENDEIGFNKIFKGEFKNGYACGFGTLDVSGIGELSGYWENGSITYLDGQHFF